LVYGNFNWLGANLVASPNLLRRFRYQLDIGLAVIANDNNQNFTLNDFINNKIKIYFLNHNEVEAVEQKFFAGNRG
jgi:hypothetical protein